VGSHREQRVQGLRGRGERLVLWLRTYPDSALRKVCEPVSRFDNTLKDRMEEMLALMRSQNGIGLAAPQVGILQRLLVCELGGHTIRLVNPKIRVSSGEADMSEECLSLPGIMANVTRCRRIRVQGYDPRGRRVDLTANDLLARVIQHEIDHLKGILICDRGVPVPADPLAGKTKDHSALAVRAQDPIGQLARGHHGGS